MTSLSRRKRPTTASPTRRATLAARFAAVVVLCATPALAQPPAGQPQSGLPLPPGYRPRTPPPAQAARPAATAADGGTVMYFQKPADALVATGGSGSDADAVAQLKAPGRMRALPSAPDAALPPPRYMPPDRPAPLAVPTATPRPQPDPKQPDPKATDPDVPPVIVNKQELKEPPGGPAVTQLPPREKIFMVYDDAQLEKAIIDRIIQEMLELNEKKGPKERKTPEELLKTTDPRSLRFPPLPVISPPGVAYQPKTSTYEPRKVIVEPGYVVHRRLYFEGMNAERAGWDFGPMQTLVSAACFWKDTLAFPHNVASGCVYGFWDTSAGKCLPGSPTPYYLYPPGLTVTGTVAEAIVITGGAAIFP